MSGESSFYDGLSLAGCVALPISNHNVLVGKKGGGEQGILIGILDFEESPNCVKVLRNRGHEYWTVHETIPLRVELRTFVDS